MLNKFLITFIAQFFIFYATLSIASEDNVLYIKVLSEKQSVVVNAKMGSSHKRFRINESKTKITSDFANLWHQLNTWEITKKSVDAYIAKYESLLLNPIEGLLSNATHIHFIVDDDSFRYALDLIPYKGKPLFLHFPISFSVHKVNVNQHSYFSKVWSGLSISDRTADPENAVSYLSELLVKNNYYKMEDLSHEELSKMGPTDVMLFSLHGKGSKSTASMDFNGESLFAKDLAHFQSKLIYLDSCEMGSSIGFLKELKKHGNEFLIAPLFSNEAGGSSTETIKGFFSNLQAGDSPAIAMYKVRKKLYNKYSQSDNVASAYWKAFPFRVFQQR
ncbi:hypothetical protein [Pseudoalteromonas sp. MMG005]|uniref:hypothetical protein n=1 Tax=Pseudoalteromonas sp. MMG005 TaxID=2822682 RepID=UPI001B39F49C|nr:hypothetical protein [Pseudoalteromonas sp. MMG005]MBQ4845046.1 hypothetical protein [Pseudoalteromonas sp. MMG005]